MFSERGIVVKPVGYVSTEVSGDAVRDKSVVSKIVVNEEFLEALEGIDEFSHVFVLFWLDGSVDERAMLKVHPRGRADLPLLGVFATRTKFRPNPIGLTLVELLSVEGNSLTVRGLDAYDGTKVLDIKPFDSWDMVSNVRVPSWWVQLEKERKNRHKNR